MSQKTPNIHELLKSKHLSDDARARLEKLLAESEPTPVKKETPTPAAQKPAPTLRKIVPAREPEVLASGALVPPMPPPQVKLGWADRGCLFILGICALGVIGFIALMIFTAITILLVNPK